MDCEPFARHFPVTFSHFDNFLRGMPHEKFAQKNAKKGKRACRVLVFQKTACCPFSTPFLTAYSFLLATLKLAEVSGRLFTLLNPTKNHIKSFILASKHATDYTLLTLLLPLKMVAEIVKLTVAMFFGSHLYFSPPKSYPPAVQMEYYQKNADRKFYQFRFARNVTLQIKAEAREIEHIHEKIIAELVSIEERISFLRNFLKLLKKLNHKKIESVDLNVLRTFCLEMAEDNDIKIAFKTPQNVNGNPLVLSVHSIGALEEKEKSSSMESTSSFYSFDSEE